MIKLLSTWLLNDPSAARLRINEALYIFRTNLGRYGEEADEDSSSAVGGRFRSRFLRGEDEEESGGNRGSVYDEGSGDKKKPERIKVVDTEDCSRGPLSGCIRLADSSRVIQRLKVSQ